MKVAIVYCSKHQGNTKKLIDAIAAKYPVDLYNIFDLGKDDINWDEYELVGIASGVFMEHFYKPILQFAEKYLPKDQKIFLLFSSGAPGQARCRRIMEIANAKEAQILGLYGCRGFYNFFPFSLVGGRRKGHPNEFEINEAVSFYESLLKQFESGEFEYIQTIHTAI